VRQLRRARHARDRHQAENGGVQRRDRNAHAPGARTWPVTPLCTLRT
jgi:hypothetical protein